MNIRNIFVLFGFLALPQLVGFLGSMVTIPALSTWYVYLVKPSLTPPDSLFAPVWITLFVIMGFAAFIVWRKARKSKLAIKSTLGIFYVQLLFNFGWSFLFFGLQNPKIASFEIIILLFLIILMMVRFFKVSKIAGYLIIPYVLWVSFATYLSFGIWFLN